MPIAALPLALLMAAATPEPAGPDPARVAGLKSLLAHEQEMRKYAVVSVAWLTEEKCHLLSDDQHWTFYSSVGDTTTRLRRLMTPAAGSEQAAQALLIDIQQKSAGFAAANYSKCDAAARETVERGLREAGEINRALADN